MIVTVSWAGIDMGVVSVVITGCLLYTSDAADE